MLSGEEKEYIIGRYLKLQKKYGYSPKSIAWPKPEGMPDFRFRILTSIDKLKRGERLLDVGCGFGDLYSFLNKHYPGISYLGVDINPYLIEEGRKVYPDADLRVGDILEEDFGTFDWVVVSGLFNSRLPQTSNEEFIKKMIQRMFEMARKGVSIDFLSTYVDFQNPRAYYTSPEWVFSFAKTLTKRVTLRHDYMPYEFCLYIYIDEAITSNNVFRRAELQWRLDNQL